MSSRRDDTAIKAGATVQSWHCKGAVIYVGGNHLYPAPSFLESKILINGLIKVNQCYGAEIYKFLLLSQIFFAKIKQRSILPKNPSIGWLVCLSIGVSI